MTIEEMDAELARMGAHLRWLRDDGIAECQAELAETNNSYLRDFLLSQIAEYRAMRSR